MTVQIPGCGSCAPRSAAPQEGQPRNVRPRRRKWKPYARAQFVSCLCTCDELRCAALAAVPVHTGTGWRKPGRASGLLTPSPMQHVERLEPPVAARKRRRRAIGFAGPGCTGCSLCSDAGFHVLRHWERLPRIAFSPEAKGAVDFSTAPFAQVFSVASLPQRSRADAPKR